MEVVDHQSTPVYEEKSFDETTIFVSENGSVSKRRRRKSLGRRVSFAEAPKLHIFPRDDEYETPTRTTNGAGSPHREGGERRSPRLAAKVVDADKENRVLASSPVSKRGRRRGGSKPLAARGGGESPALKPQNWLDARDTSLQASDGQENTGPVDLRHLSFNEKENETDEENITLDSTTFALKSLQQIRRGDPAAVVQLDKNSSAAVSTYEDGFSDEEVLKDILENDMSFTMNRPLLRRKPVRESLTGFGEISVSSDTNMSLTMQVSGRRKQPHMPVGGDNITVQMEEDSITLSPQKSPPARKATLPGSRDDNSGVLLNSHDAQNGPALVPRGQDGRAQIMEKFGDLVDDTSPAPLDFLRPLKLPLQGIENPRAEDVRAQNLERFDNGGDPLTVTLQGVQIARTEDLRAPLEEGFGVDVGDPGDDTHLSTGSEESHPTGTVDMSFSSPGSVSSMGHEDRTMTMGVPSHTNVNTGSDVTLDATGTITMGIPSLRQLIREEEDEENEESSSTDHKDRTITTVVPSYTNVNTGREEMNLDATGTVDMSVSSPGSVSSMGQGDRSITMGIPSLRQLIREEEDEESSSIGYKDRTITIPSHTNVTTGSEADLAGSGTVDIRVSSPESVSSMGREDQNARSPLSVEEFLHRTEVHSIGYKERTITMSIHSHPNVTPGREQSLAATGTVEMRVSSPGSVPSMGHEDQNVSSPLSVEEFLRQAEVQFSLGLQSLTELFKDPSLAETHHVRSLSESFHFLCLVKPQLEIMRDACEELYEEVGIKATAVAEVEQRLTASNPAILSYFQKAPEGEKQRIRKQLQRIQGSYRLLAEKNRLYFQLRVETSYKTNLLVMKNDMTYYVEHIQEQRNMFHEKCYLPFVRLQASLSSRDANQACVSTSQSKLSNAEHLRTTVNLERIEDLKERLEDLKSSMELRLAKLRPRKQVAEETLRGLKQRLKLANNNLSDLRSQLVDKVCSGKNNLQREDVAHSPYLHVQKMRTEVCFLDKLQDGFRVKSVGRENEDLVVELSYLSLVKRRYVVRKVGTEVKVLRCSWSLEPEKIEEMFPKMNALLAFSLTLRTSDISTATATNATAWTQMFVRLSALEAVRFTLSSDKPGSSSEPTNLRESMQVTRILVGNLMELMQEIGELQPVVNASSGGGILVEPRFRNAPDGQLQLELKFIDCILSIKFFLYLDMSCVPMTGYPLGDLPAEVEIAYCPSSIRHRFKRETLKDILSVVKPGYHRLLRTLSAVGSFLASLRRGV